MDRDLPLSVYLNLHLDSEDGVFEVRLGIDERREERDFAAVNPSIEMVRLCVAGCNLGLFSRDTNNVANCVVVSQSVLPESQEIVFLVRTQNIEVSFWLVLIALLIQCELEGDPLLSIKVSQKEDQGKVPIVSFAHLRAYCLALELPKDFPIPTEILTEYFGCLGHDLRVWFDADIDSQVMAVLKHSLEVWDEIRAFGGFSDSFVDEVCFDSMGEVSIEGRRCLRMIIPTVLDISAVGINAVLKGVRFATLKNANPKLVELT
jgi:hypothetical protein